MSTTRLRLHVGIILSGGSGRKRGGGGDAEETPDECDLLPLGGHSWRGRDKCSRPAINGKFNKIHRNVHDSSTSTSALTTATGYALF